MRNQLNLYAQLRSTAGEYRLDSSLILTTDKPLGREFDFNFARENQGLFLHLRVGVNKNEARRGRQSPPRDHEVRLLSFEIVGVASVEKWDLEQRESYGATTPGG